MSEVLKLTGENTRLFISNRWLYVIHCPLMVLVNLCKIYYTCLGAFVSWGFLELLYFVYARNESAAKTMTTI